MRALHFAVYFNWKNPIILLTLHLKGKWGNSIITILFWRQLQEMIPTILPEKEILEGMNLLNANELQAMYEMTWIVIKREMYVYLEK